MRNICSTRKSSVLISTTSANDLPLRIASSRHWIERHDTECSSVRFNDSSMAPRLAETALRMAGPMTGNRASASGFGLRLTEAVMAFSSGGVSALARLGSCACWTSTCGSTSPMSSARATGSSSRACSVASRCCSRPQRIRRSEAISASGSESAALLFAPSSRGRAARSPAAAIVDAGDGQLVVEPHRHFGQQSRERRAVGLVVTELGGLLSQSREHLVDLPAEIIGQLLVQLEDLLTELALHASDLIVEHAGFLLEGLGLLAQFAGKIPCGVGAFVVFRFDAIGERS